MQRFLLGLINEEVVTQMGDFWEDIVMGEVSEIIEKVVQGKNEAKESDNCINSAIFFLNCVRIWF